MCVHVRVSVVQVADILIKQEMSKTVVAVRGCPRARSLSPIARHGPLHAALESWFWGAAPPGPMLPLLGPDLRPGCIMVPHAPWID